MRKLLISALGFIASTCTAQTFQNPRLVPTPHAINAILHGDLNNDGIDDLIYDDSSASPVKLHVMLGNGRGGFASGETVTLPSYASSSCKLNTFTGSGNLDIACIVQPATLGYNSLPWSIVIFPGRGDGTFGAAVTKASTDLQYNELVLIDAGDLNGDGIPDMVVEKAGQGIPVLSDGHGGWAIGKAGFIYNVPIYTGDLNGDGKADWVFPGPVVALGNGEGTFGNPQNFGPANFPPLGCALGDLDGDGHVDAACGYADTTTGDINGHWSIRFFHGNPDGTFTYLPSDTMAFGDGSHEDEDYGSMAMPRYIVDLDGDGIPDLLGFGADGLTAYYGKGTYQFGPPLHFAAGNLNDPIGMNTTNWVLTDINADHISDVVSGGFDGLLLTLGKSGGGFATGSAYEVNGVVGYAAVADFNGDGIPDIVSTGDFHMAISLGRGDGTFLPYKNLDTGAVHWEGLYDHPDDNLLIHGDFNGDGKEDLIAVGSDVSGSFTENDYYLQGNGDGTFQPPLSISAAPFLSYLYGLSIVADVNGDHRDDVLGKPDPVTGQIPVTLSQGDGAFITKNVSVPQEPIPTYTSSNYSETFPAVADFDGDGKPDIIVGSHSNAYFLHGNGDGTFSNPVAISIPPRINAGSNDGSISVVAGDFDGDGHQDFAVLWGTVTYGVYIDGPGSFGEIVVYYGRGDGTFSAPVIAAANTTADYVHLAAADLSHNGRDGLVAYSSGTLDGGTNVGVLAGAVNRTFSAITPLVAGYGLVNLQISDLNKDGLPDLVFSNEDYNVADNSATVLLNLGTRPIVTGSLSAVPEPSFAGNMFTLNAIFSTPDASLINGTVIFSIDGNVVGSASLANNIASLNITTGNYALGAHTLSASWGGDGNFDGVTFVGAHSIVAIPSSTTLSSSLSPSNPSQPVTFTAHVTAQNVDNGTPAGSVTFTDGSTPLGSQVLDASGNASLTSSTLSDGAHVIVASYISSNSFASSNASLTQTVNAIATATVLTVAPSTSTFGTTLTLTASVTAPGSSVPAITGAVTFCSIVIPVGQTVCSGTILGTAAVDATGMANLPLSNAPGGTSTFGCVYNGDASHASSVCNGVPVTVNPASTALTLTSSANPSTALTLITFTAALTASGSPLASRTLTFSIDGRALPSATTATSGFATLITSLPAGSHTVTVAYAATPSYTASSAQLTESTTPNPTRTTLVAPSGTIYENQPVILTATIQALSGGATPDGSVTFFDGSLALGTITLPASDYTGTIRTANLSTVTLTSGGHALSAVYTPQMQPIANFVSSASASPSIDVLPQTFTITMGDPALTIETEFHRTTTVTLTSIGGFAGRVTLSCGSLPEYASCNWSDTTLLVPANGTVSTHLDIDTDALLNYKSSLEFPSGPWQRSGGILLAVIAPLILIRRRRRISALLAFPLLLAFGLAIAGCSSKYPGHTPPGTYIISIQGTGASSGAAKPVAQSASLKLVVTP